MITLFNFLYAIIIPIEIAALNLAKFRKVAGALGDAEVTADENEQAFARMKARARSASIGPM